MARVDTFLVNCPRKSEQEPGFRQTLVLNARDDRVRLSEEPPPGAASDDQARETTAYFEPRSKRWMGKPYLVALADPGGPTSWSTSGAPDLRDIAPRDQGGLRQALADPTAEGYGVEYLVDRTPGDDPRVLTSADDLEVLRGIVLAVTPYEPVDWNQATAPFHIVIAQRLKLVLTPSATGAAVAVLFQRDQDQPSTWSADGTPIALVSGDWFGRTHRLWFQPLGPDEVLVANFDDEELGQVVKVQPVEYQPTQEEAGEVVPEGVDPDEMEPPPTVAVPWSPDKLQVESWNPYALVASYVVHAATWSLASRKPTDLGYETTEQPDMDVRVSLPDTGFQNGGYLATYGALADDGSAFGGDAKGKFTWSAAVTGPADLTFEERDFAFRTATLAGLTIRWPLTLTDGTLVAVDLSTRDDVGVDGITETLTDDDAQATLVLRVDGPKADVDQWLRPASRWQWLTDDAGTVRFDGLLDRTGERSVYMTLAGEYRVRAKVSLRKRWRQVDRQLFRGSIPLDGLKRSEVYQLLAEQVPLDPATEIDVATDLRDDLVLPTTRHGDEPAFLPQAGTTLGEVIRDLRRMFGHHDLVRFLGTVFTVTDRSEDLVATFHRHPDQVPELPDGLVHLVIGAADATQAFDEQEDDDSFVNDLWVIGRDPDSPRERPKPIVGYVQDPASWQDDTAPLFVGTRRTILVQRPELTSQAAVNAVARSVWQEFHRFPKTTKVTAAFDPALQYGDRAVLEAGADPTATDCLVEVVGMVTACRDKPWSYQVDQRWETTYTLRLVEESYVPPDEEG